MEWVECGDCSKPSRDGGTKMWRYRKEPLSTVTLVGQLPVGRVSAHRSSRIILFSMSCCITSASLKQIPSIDPKSFH